MADEESGDDDPWFEGLTDTDGDEFEPSGTAADDAARSIQSTEEWEWGQPDDPQSDSEDEPGNGERLWEQFEDIDQDPRAGTEAFRSGAGTDDRETQTGTDSPGGTVGEADGAAGRVNPPEGASTAPQSGDTQSGATDDGPTPGSEGTSGAGVPPPPGVGGQSGDGDHPRPPTAEGQTGDTGPTSEPADTDIREMQPLYKRRSKEFYLLWLAAALSYGLGDMITTSYVFVTPRLGESNPFVSLLLGQFGLAGFVGAKLGIFGLLITIGVVGAIENERLSYYGPPVLAFLVGTGLTVWNLRAILGL